MKIFISFLILFFSLNFVESSDRSKIEKIEIIAEEWATYHKSRQTTEYLIYQRSLNLNMEITDNKIIKIFEKLLTNLVEGEDTTVIIDTRIVIIFVKKNNDNDTLSFGKTVDWNYMEFNGKHYNLNQPLFEIVCYILPSDYKKEIDYEKSFDYFFGD
jgi:hypothetical protein